MNLVQRVPRFLASISRRFQTIDDLDRLMDMLIGGNIPTRAGPAVTSQTAMSSAAFYNGVVILTSMVALLPVRVYKRRAGGKGRDEQDSHPMTKPLTVRANRFQTPFEWKEMMMGHLILRGNHFSRIVFDEKLDQFTLIPKHPDRMVVGVLPGGELGYLYRDENGRPEAMSAGEVLHVRGMSDNGYIGKSVITHARESLGLTLAQEEMAQRLFSQDARPGGVIKYPGVLEPDVRARLEDSFQKVYAGLSNKHKVMLLEEGMEWDTVGYSAEDSQFLESRVHQTTEVARWLNLPPHMLKELSRATFSNIEEQSLDFVRISLMPWLVRIEQRMGVDLFSTNEMGTTFPKFLVQALLRGDSKARSEFYTKMIDRGVFSINDVLELEDRNPIGPDGDKRMVPMNFIELKQLGEDTMGGGDSGGGNNGDGGNGGDGQDQNDQGGDGSDSGGNGSRGEQFICMDSTHGHESPEEARACIGRSMDHDRAIRSLKERVKTGVSYQRLFASSFKTIVRREKKELEKRTRKITVSHGPGDIFKGNAELVAIIASFYTGHRGYVYRITRPLFDAYAESVARTALVEVGSNEDVAEVMAVFAERYADKFATAYAEKNRVRMEKVISEAVLAGIEQAEELQAALDAKLEHFEERIPDDEAQRQVIEAGNAFAQKTWQRVGVRSKVWVANADACPLCQELNGREVGMSENFVMPGQEIDPNDGKTSPLVARHKIGHPGLHDGCTCMLKPK